jgi:hypothetical protein
MVKVCRNGENVVCTSKRTADFVEDERRDPVRKEGEEKSGSVDGEEVEGVQGGKGKGPGEQLRFQRNRGLLQLRTISTEDCFNCRLKGLNDVNTFSFKLKIQNYVK